MRCVKHAKMWGHLGHAGATVALQQLLGAVEAAVHAIAHHIDLFWLTRLARLAVCVCARIVTTRTHTLCHMHVASARGRLAWPICMAPHSPVRG